MLRVAKAAFAVALGAAALWLLPLVALIGLYWIVSLL